MSSVETPGIPEAVKKEVKDMLNPYFTRDYRDDVRNPVLLLNFLHQHNVISKPVYSIRADPNKLFHFIGTCSLGPFNSEDSAVLCSVPALTVEADAGSKRECKNMAAQKILNLFLENEKTNLTDDCDDREKQIDLQIGRTNVVEAPEEFVLDEFMGMGLALMPLFTSKTDNFYEDDLTGIVWFDDYVVDVKRTPDKKKRKKRPKSLKKSAKIFADPQCGGECNVSPKVDQIVDTSVSNHRNGAGSSAAAEASSQIAECASIDNATLKELSSATTLSKWLKEEESTSETKKASSSRTRKNRKKAADKMGSTSSLSSTSSTSSGCRSADSAASASSSSASQSRNQIIPHVIDDVFESFFDPFSKLRPKIISYLNASQKENAVSVAGNGNTFAQNATAASVQSKFPMEICSHTKTPFQILQERAVKHYKLIPRSRIDKIGDAFSCTLILDSHRGHGEGRTKKEAKVKAAIDVLQQLEDFTRSN